MTKEKTLDAVKMMREIRDELSRNLMMMSHEEQRDYIGGQLRGSGSMGERERCRRKL